MWFQLKVLALLFVLLSFIAWCGRSGQPAYQGLQESAWRALDASIRDLASPNVLPDRAREVDENPVALAARRRVNSAPRVATTSAARKRISAYTMKRVGAKYGWRCARCKAVLRDDFHVDHIVPLHRRLALGQPLDNDVDSCQPLCPSCHMAKNHEEQSR